MVSTSEGHLLHFISLSYFMRTKKKKRLLCKCPACQLACIRHLKKVLTLCATPPGVLCFHLPSIGKCVPDIVNTVGCICHGLMVKFLICKFSLFLYFLYVCYLLDLCFFHCSVIRFTFDKINHQLHLNACSSARVAWPFSGQTVPGALP